MTNNLEGYATLLINESIKLESSNAYSIRNYMVNEHGIDWDDNAIYRMVAEDLEKTMKLVKVEYNGYVMNEWIDKY